MEFYHVLNRGVEKRDIVLDDDDRMRFVRSLYVFNDAKAAPNALSQSVVRENLSRKRDCLVRIHAWCLMNNHYHLLVSPMDDELSKMSLFMKKLNGGYAKFFNEKYDRSGYLWQGKFKRVKIERDAQFLYIPYYIHMNPLDYTFSAWREGNLRKFDQVTTFLSDFRWSSYQDYMGKKNFPSILWTDIMTETLGSNENQLRQMKSIGLNPALARGANKLET